MESRSVCLPRTRKGDSIPRRGHTSPANWESRPSHRWPLPFADGPLLSPTALPAGFSVCALGCSYEPLALCRRSSNNASRTTRRNGKLAACPTFSAAGTQATRRELRFRRRFVPRDRHPWMEHALGGRSLVGRADFGGPIEMGAPSRVASLPFLCYGKDPRRQSCSCVPHHGPTR